MSSTPDGLRAQRNSQAMHEFMEEEPEWFARGMLLVNAWGRAEGYLQHLVAAALKAEYERGAAGLEPTPLPEPEPVQTVFKRTRVAPPPPPELPPLKPLRPATNVAMNRIDPADITSASALRLKLRMQGIVYDEIELAVQHWERGQ